MANSNLTYRVTGRYMTGSTVVSYHLVGEEGSQIVAGKERIIYMIGKGQIENMRLQSDGTDMIIRGKGVNLNTLPVFDTAKGNFRGNQASQTVASTNVTPKKDSGINPMGQFTIIKRIMYKTTCLGYVVKDISDIEKRLKRSKVVELATQKLISNAIVQRYTPKGQTEYQLVLRGVGCDIGELPVVAVDQNGNIIDTATISKEQYVYMRAVKMKRGGIIYDEITSKKIAFEPGDYIICGIESTIRTLKAAEIESRIVVGADSSTAVCDEYLNNLDKYPVELFGSTSQTLKPEQVKRWPIVKVKRN